MVPAIAKREVIKAKNLLFDLFRQRNITLDKVVIFGSFTKNNVRPDSDLDIILVSKNFRNKNLFERIKLAQGIHWSLGEKIHRPIDLMYYSDKE